MGFQVAMVSGAALVLPAPFQDGSERIIVSHYVTSYQCAYQLRMEYPSVCLLQSCLLGLPCETDTISRYGMMHVKCILMMYATFHMTSLIKVKHCLVYNLTCYFSLDLCRVLSATTLQCPVSVSGAPGVRCTVS